MKILLRSVKIIDVYSRHHHEIRDVLLQHGIIKKISKSIKEKADKIFEGEGNHLSTGWFDLHVNFREPGFEYKEDLLSGCNAAMAGGFTGVLVMPSTFPPVQSKSELELIRTKTKNELVDVFAAGALSENLEGKNLSEFFDMSSNGAVAFTDDKNSVQDAGLLLRALLYTKNSGVPILTFASDKNIASSGQVNESEDTIHLGLKTIPPLAEELMVSRDLFLAQYAGAKIHFSTISTEKSVSLIREAKARGQKVTCDIAAHQLLLDDSLLGEFDTNLKVMPPLRTKKDIEALKVGLKDGTIDCISSDHSPEDIENKKKEFDLAAFGISSVETAFAAANTSTENILTTEHLLDKFTTSPRKILSLALPSIKEGEEANLTLFNPSFEWTVEELKMKSKSKNSPFIGTTLKGKVLAVFNKGMFFEN